MKNLLKIFTLLFATGFIFTACEDDTPGGGGGLETGPTLSVTTEASTVMAGETFTVTVNGTAGDGEMNSLRISEDGVAIDPTRIESITGILTPNNPQLLTGTDRTSFSFEIVLSAHTTATANVYDFEVTDANSNTDSKTVTITVESNPPTFTNMGPQAFVDVEQGSLISFMIHVVAGSTSLDNISVYEDDVLVDAARVSLGSTNFDANPYILTDAWRDEIMETIFIRAHNDESTKTYRVVVADESGMEAEVSVDITTKPVGTPIEANMGVLFNAGGPVGKGGLDLDDAVGTGSGSMLAEIRDLGIDTDLDPASNWIQRIVGVNGFEARYLIQGQNGLSESFTFESLSLKEEIVTLWDNNSIPFTSTDEGGNTVSFVVEVNDIFVISNGTNYYVINVTDVNVTVDNNDDSYTIDIKK